MRRLLVLLLIAVFSNVVHGETLYVNNVTGNDLNSGFIDDNQGANDGPLRSIGAAVKRANRGDRIVLANTGVSYRECVTLQGTRNSGSLLQPFVIDGNGATLDGTGMVPAERWEFVRGSVYRFVPARGGHQQLFVDGEVAEQLPRFDGRGLSTLLQPKQWCRCNGAIHFAAEKGKSPDTYDLRYAKHRVGITLYNVDRVVVHNLNVRGFQLDGINAHDNAMDCVLSEVSCTDNGRSGISIGGASRVRVIDSQLHDNSDVQLRAEGWSTSRLHGTRMVSDARPIWTRQANTFGRGARVFVDDVLQLDRQGWRTKQDQESQTLKQDLDELEQSDGRAGDVEPSDEPVTPEADVIRENSEIEGAPSDGIPAPISEAAETPDDPFGDEAESEQPADDPFEDSDDGTLNDDPFDDI